AGEAAQLGHEPAVVRLVPGRDGAPGQAAAGVRDHQRLVDLDQVAEAVAGRTGPEGVVEGEEARLRLLEGGATVRAVEALREAQLGPSGQADVGLASALGEGGLPGAGQAREG